MDFEEIIPTSNITAEKKAYSLWATRTKNHRIYFPTFPSLPPLSSPSSFAACHHHSLGVRFRSIASKLSQPCSMPINPSFWDRCLCLGSPECHTPPMPHYTCSTSFQSYLGTCVYPLVSCQLHAGKSEVLFVSWFLVPLIEPPSELLFKKWLLYKFIVVILCLLGDHFLMIVGLHVKRMGPGRRLRVESVIP